MSLKKLKIYCVTNKEINFLKNNQYDLCWVGDKDAPQNYLTCNSKKNIFYKEKYYSELTFHYWYWKNLLQLEKKDQWVGFCQKRRFWIKENPNFTINHNNINEYLLIEPLEDWSNYQAIICKPIKVFGAKKIKMLKRGWKNLIKNPAILFNEKEQNISFHFDMHHGYGNLAKAINELDDENRDDFRDYVIKNNTFNPHIMFIAKPEVINKWFESLFSWLGRCEKQFKFENLKDYDTSRLFAYLAERYLSYWFKKNTVFKEENWVQLDNF